MQGVVQWAEGPCNERAGRLPPALGRPLVPRLWGLDRTSAPALLGFQLAGGRWGDSSVSCHVSRSPTTDLVLNHGSGRGGGRTASLTSPVLAWARPDNPSLILSVKSFCHVRKHRRSWIRTGTPLGTQAGSPSPQGAGILERNAVPTAGSEAGGRGLAGSTLGTLWDKVLSQGHQQASVRSWGLGHGHCCPYASLCPSGNPQAPV